MVKFFCAIPGVAGSAFSVAVDADETVDDLKKKIKEVKPHKITCDADDLQLSLAKKGDGWLPSNDLAALQEGGAKTPVGFEKVPLTDATWSIHDVLKEQNMPNPGTRQIHVLVVVPYPEQAQVDMVHESLSLARQASVRQSRMEMRLEQLAASLPHKNSKSYTDGALGQLLLDRLKKDKMFFDLPPTDGGEAFWSADIQLQANAIENERRLHYSIFQHHLTQLWSSLRK